MRLHRRLLSIAAFALAAAAAPPGPAAAAVDRTPGITSVSPAHGPAAGGNVVRVSTRSVSGDVTFGGVPAANAGPVLVGDDFENGIAYFTYTVTVPPGVAGKTVDVRVGQSGGTTATSDDYTYDGPKEPLTGQCGSTFTVASGWGTPTFLNVGGVRTPFRMEGNTITFDAPDPAYASGLAYPVGGVFSDTSRSLGTYRNGCFSPLPSASDRSEGIASVAGVNRGPAAGGDLIVVKAFGDIPASAELWVGDQRATGVTVSSNGVSCIPEDPRPCTQPAPGELGWLIGGTTPPGADGWVDLSIRFGDKIIWGQTASSNDYHYIGPPAIQSVTPGRGPLAGGGTVDVFVSGDWVRNPVVTFGGVASTEVSFTSSNAVYDGTFGQQRITARVPAGVSAGTVDVKATGTSLLVSGPLTATGVAATADDYTYEAPAPPPPPVNAPKVTGVSGTAFAGVGGLITIRGANLGGLRSVKVGNRTATVLLSNATQIYAFAPAQGKGSYPVTVTTRVGSATAPANLVYRTLF